MSNHKPHKDRDLGGLGENVLERWGYQVGFTFNKVQRDRTGWDYFIELPISPESRPHSNLPLDLDLNPLKCLVQVKATDGQARTIKTKLDNWIHLIENPLPAFFLALEFDGKREAQRAFLIHVGEKIIYRVKERLRKLGTVKEPALHRKTMQVTFGERNKLDRCDEVEFVQAIRAHVGESLHEYAARKRKTLEEVGYDDIRSTIKVTFEIPPELDIPLEEYLIEFSLGLRPPLRVINFKAWDIRFGIQSPQPIHESDSGNFKFLEEPLGEAEIKIHTADYQSSCSLKTQLYVPRGFGPLVDEEYLKYRFTAPYLDIILWPKGNRFNFDAHFPSANESHFLSDLVQFADFILLLQKAKMDETRVYVKPCYQTDSIFPGSFKSENIPDLGNHVVRLSRIIQNAWTVAKYFNIHQDLELQLQDLESFENELAILVTILNPEPITLGVEFTLEKMVETPVQKKCAPIPIQVLLGPFRITMVFALLALPELTGEIVEEGFRYKLENTYAGLFRKHIEKSDTPSEIELREIYDDMVEKYDKLSIDCVIPAN